ncbi:peptide chain release factor N(5)-glutamine methyltransferase [bacterium]|nr:peptide chain release factor N(5)-glutamine methyltransferase [bacterium]
MGQESPTPPAQEVWTVRRVLEWTTGHLKKHGSETPRLEAEILLAHARKCPRIKLYTDYDEPLTDAVRAQMRELVQRRAAHEPVAYLVGHREFFSLDFDVNPAVLIPRPDTETLVLAALDIAKPLASPTLLDLCTGSGCVAIALAKNLPAATIHASDISPEALAIAQKNAEKHGVLDRWVLHHGDLWSGLDESLRFDVIVSNPPYIRQDELPTLAVDVQKYEPTLALDGGIDGLDFVRRIITEAPRRLKPGGWLLLEIDPAQFGAVDQLAEQQGGYATPVPHKDMSGRPRVWSAALKP